jgi:hypothetical protein
MDNEVIGAIISAAASVVVAVISKAQPEKSVETGSDSSHVKSSIRPWIATGGVLTAWFLASPGLIHNEFAWQNFILIPLVVIGLALLRPIKPLMATSITLAFFATNWIAGPWSNRLAHSGMGVKFPTADNHYLHFVLFLASVSAGLAFLLSLWRNKNGSPAGPRSIDLPPSAMSNGGLVNELERLAHLYNSGDLTVDEFSRAKTALLGRGGPQRISSRSQTELAL